MDQYVKRRRKSLGSVAKPAWEWPSEEDLHKQEIGLLMSTIVIWEISHDWVKLTIN